VTADDIRAAGLSVDRVGAAWRICGPGVDIKTANLESIKRSDITPVLTDAEARRWVMALIPRFAHRR